jgi:aminoglycoside phosphotransferase (APT) family kinase protein
VEQKSTKIDAALAHRLIESQFPQWKDLSIEPVAFSGWDNRTFHLGKQMLIRMPKREEYALQVEKEQKWLPKLSPHLPLPIPTPLAMGHPGCGYPWKWSIYPWLEGETASAQPVEDLCQFAADLAQFLIAFHRIDTTGGPIPGLHSFYRGGPLSVYDADTRRAIALLADKIDTQSSLQVWETALGTTWHKPPVWVHGDISVGNLLVKKGKLSGVIDFGQLAIGDPACDLMIAWTFFKGESRAVFRQLLSLDAQTWERARAWTLWKSLIVAAGFSNPNNAESKQSWRIIEEVLTDP